ncbi:DNA adenine methylase [Cyclobacterium plantarum]|uniref:site-specific DNA-methyltransferase (adenine-specific) n=1 Tax=Cyclobacterium plantarum TaxID=2716263 RepID=A0ABX0HDA4_9BACT|nr:DNA adenine methylase [Cyclobacterium plantarum]NHE57965.1 DNA adenine methylase [Cyclobacterium plantarum]
MKYLGSKRRIAKYILPIILKDKNTNQIYIEPFAGGCNTLDKVQGKRVANDINFYLVEMYKALQNGWIPPNKIDLEEYKDIRNNKGKYPPELVGFVGFGCSFGGKWFGGYARGNNSLGAKRNYCDEAKRNLLKQIANLKDVKFINKSYDEIDYPKNSLIYCDPPYKDTTEYMTKFDSLKFYDWVKDMTNQNHKVYFSEYSAPKEFKCIWSYNTTTNLNINQHSTRIEKLFIF